MGYMLHVLVFTLACVATRLVTAQEDCVPGYVDNLRMTLNRTIVWETPASENCEIAYYIIYIGLADSTVIWTHNVVGTTELDISFLIPCYGYTVRVHQVSTSDITGNGWATFITTQPPSDADLALKYLQYSREGTNIRLDWSLEEEWIPCARRYRVLTYNEDTDTAVDFYTPLNSLTMYNLVPCARYTFGVTAIFTLEEEGPVSTVRTTAPAYHVFAPQLESYTLGATSVRITLLLEEEQFNRCPITSLRVATVAPATSTITYPITNQANRSPFTITLGGLQPDSMYVLNITANNTAGWSTPLLFGIQTTLPVP